MTVTVTLAVLAASLASAGFFIWLERRPPDFSRVRMVPTTPLIFASVLVAVVMIVHIVNLMGVQTGR